MKLKIFWSIKSTINIEWFTRYVHSKLVKTLSLYYHELMGKIKEHEGKKYETELKKQ